MKRTVGETYEFMNESYVLKEDVILPENEKNSFILKLNGAAILFIVLLGVPTWLLFPNKEFALNVWELLLYALSFIVFIVVHELLHGITFALFSGNGFKSITFGLVLRSGMAYCISKVPVKVPRARWSLMMPVYVVCVPLFVYGVWQSSLPLAILAILFASGSVGDFYYMWKLRGTDRSLYMYEEMPTKSGYEIGYLLFEKQ